MKFQSVIAISAALVATSFAMNQPSFHTKGAPTGKPTGQLKPGEYWWKPGLSPRGPVVALVSLPQQTMYVYRNGILIGRSSVSSGRKGNSTPPGVFNILEKKKTHRSKKYNNAPMAGQLSDRCLSGRYSLPQRGVRAPCARRATGVPCPEGHGILPNLVWRRS